MSSNYDGTFSASFLSLRLQLDTLLEEVGGKAALDLLDSLATLTPTEQQAALRAFTAAAKRFAESDKRLTTQSDTELKKFEDELYEGIVAAIDERAASTTVRGAKPKLSVVNGAPRQQRVVPFRKARDIASGNKIQ